MKNLGERIDIGHGARADDGTKLEPEEQPVRRVIATEAEAKHGDNVVGAIRTNITADMTAIEAAAILSQPCHLCMHWRPDEWPAARRRLESTPEGLADLNRMRAALLGSGSAGLANGDEGFDVEHALAHGRIGVCKALSDLFRDDMLTEREATCPSQGPNGETIPPLFVAKRGDARRASDSTRDSVLRTASKHGR